jgi:hypothetical protein
MKKKLTKIMGIGFALLLVASMLLFAIPAAAGAYDPLVPIPSNMWIEFTPTYGVFGAWFYSQDIEQVGPVARAINGDIYVHVTNATSPGAGPATPLNPTCSIDSNDHDIFKSVDNGRTWSVSSVPFYYFNTNTGDAGGPVVDMVCSDVSEDILYLTDGNYVFKSINGALSFALVVPDDLEKKLCGACGIGIFGQPITSIDLGYDGSGQPIVLIGTRYVYNHVQPNGDPAIGTVLWIADETFSAEWTDLQVSCFGCCPVDITAQDTGINTSASNGPFSGTLIFPPLMPGTITIWDSNDDEHFTDPDGDGVLTGDAGGYGAIDYGNGDWSVTYGGAGASGVYDILATYESCYGCYDVLAVAAAPGFNNVPKVYAVVTAPLFTITFPLNTAASVEVRAGDNGAQFNYETLPGGITCDVASGAAMTANQVATFTATGTHAAQVNHILVTDGTISWRLVTGAATFCGGTRVISTLTVCSWGQVTELMWDCRWSYTSEHASRIVFPSYYGTEPTLFVGTVAIQDWDGSSPDGTLNDWWGEGGDVYRVADTIPPSGCIDLNVQGFSTGCSGIRHANICSLDIDSADALAAGAWDEYQLQAPTRVYYSADGGWTWAPSIKNPTGLDRTYVLFGAGGSLLAMTRKCDCGVSLSCGSNLGQYFNQISLINMNIDAVLDMTHSPGYATDSETMYVLTQDVNACLYSASMEIRSLLRWDGTYWERVYSSRFFLLLTTQDNSMYVSSPMYDWVEVSPDFNSTSTLYLANTGFYMARSIDAGCSWAPLTYPCFDRPSISAWIVVNEDTVLCAGGGAFAGNIYRTTNHGAQPWSVFAIKNTLGVAACNGVDFDLSIPRAADSDVLFGDACGQVYLSQDLGATWMEIRDTISGAFNYDGRNTLMTYVVFDPGYTMAGDPGENTFYAAAGSAIGRCTYSAAALPFKQNWLYMNPGSGTCLPCTLCVASGIDAAGDTVLYVADAGSCQGASSCTDFSGTIGVRYPGDTGYETCDITVDAACASYVSGTFTMYEPVMLVGCNLQCDGTGAVDGTIQVVGLVNGGVATVPIEADLGAACEDCLENNDLVECIDSELHVSSLPTGGSDCEAGVWRTVDALALIDESKSLNYVEWEFLAASETPVPANTIGEIWHPAATAPTGPIYTAFTVYPDDLWLTKGSNVLWVLDDTCETSPTPDIWMWDDPLATPVVQLSPADGALLATTTTATLEWEALDGATAYEVYIYSYCVACPDNMVLFDDFETTLTCIVVDGLTPGMTYYWKVRVACDSPKVSKWSDLRSFDTALGAVPYLCAPWCGQDDVIITTNFAWDPVVGANSYEVQIATDEAFSNIVSSGTTTVNAWTPASALDYSTVYFWRVRAVKDGVYSAWAVCIFTTAAEPVEPPPAQPPVVVEQTEITPVWIWVIIGIGGALTIAVVILIVTTRRVP